MLFNSFEFPVFLAVTWVVYAAIQRFRWPRLAWLLLISAFFYGAWHPWYLVLILLSTLNSYAFGGWISRSDSDRARKVLLTASVSGDLLLLGVFKYGNFVMESVEVISGSTLQLPRLTTELPVGISFYTFQSISYTVDVYRRKIPRARNLLEFSVFVFFFPQLVAGPIVRASWFLPRLEGQPQLEKQALGSGLFLILAGLAKKVVIADSLATLVVLPYFDDPASHNAVETVFAVWAANFQVYCDFSGYSDVAIGSALLFGFALPLNFDRPFWSRSPMEHWRRWHISLSFFLRDFLYIPLGGSRHGPLRTDVNLVITFLLGGLWHGAGWTFVVWGFYNGLLLVVWRRWNPPPAKSWWGIALQVFATFNAICLGLVFLHAHSFADAWASFATLLRWGSGAGGVFTTPALLAFGAAVFLHGTPKSWKEELQAAFAEMPAWGLGAVIVLAGGVLSLFAGLAQPFFYFQF